MRVGYLDQRGSLARATTVSLSHLHPNVCLLCFDSDVTAAVLADMPMDSTSVEDILHAALLKKEAAKVASAANDMDLWLAAHITDLMLPLQLPESSVLAYVLILILLLWTCMLIWCTTGVFDGISFSPMQSRYCPTRGFGGWL